MENNQSKQSSSNTTITLLSTEELLKILKEQRPKLKNKWDAISITLHIIMKQLGFRFLGCGDKNEEQGDLLVPIDWNKSSEYYSFRYKHPQSSMTFTIKLLPIGDKILVHGLAEEDKNIRTLELNVDDFINPKGDFDDYNNVYKNVEKLINSFKTEVVSKLLPMSTSEAPETETTTNNNRTPQTQRGQSVVPPPIIPIFDPYYERSDEQIFPLYGGPPFGLGSGDLNPLGPGFHGNNGNLIGPNHPGFGNPRDPYSGMYGGNRRGRGRGPPPGARFDPYGPPGFPFNREPDPDEPPPPGFENMFL